MQTRASLSFCFVVAPVALGHKQAGKYNLRVGKREVLVAVFIRLGHVFNLGHSAQPVFRSNFRCEAMLRKTTAGSFSDLWASCWKGNKKPAIDI